MAAFSMPVHNAGAAGWDDGPAREQVCKHCLEGAVELAIFQLSAVTIKSAVSMDHRLYVTTPACRSTACSLRIHSVNNTFSAPLFAKDVILSGCSQAS